MNNIPQRIKIYADFIGESLRQIELKIGASNSTISRAVRDNKDIGSNWIEKIIYNYPNINTNWLITGNGDMIIDEKGNQNVNPNVHPNVHLNVHLNDKNSISEPVVSYEKEKVIGRIPLIPAKAMAGLGTGQFTIMEYDVEQYYVIPDFKQADFLIRVSGSSMYPKYNSGDLIACKHIKSSSFIQWNKTHLLNTTQGALVKRLIKSDNPDCLICRSDNKDYPDFEINTDEILGVAIVLGVLRLE